jgi:hypothetical protein
MDIRPLPEYEPPYAPISAEPVTRGPAEAIETADDGPATATHSIRHPEARPDSSITVVVPSSPPKLNPEAARILLAIINDLYEQKIQKDSHPADGGRRPIADPRETSRVRQRSYISASFCADASAGMPHLPCPFRHLFTDQDHCLVFVYAKMLPPLLFAA